MTTLERLTQLEAAATPGPWRQTGTKAKPHWYVMSPEVTVHGTFPASRDDYAKETTDRWCADAALIAELRTAAPKLLAVAEAARTMLALSDALRAALEANDE